MNKWLLRAALILVSSASAIPTQAADFQYRIYDDFEDTTVDLTKWDTDSVVNDPNGDIGWVEASAYLNVYLPPNRGVNSAILESTESFYGDFDVSARWYSNYFLDADPNDGYGAEDGLYVFGVNAPAEVSVSRGIYPYSREIPCPTTTC